MPATSSERLITPEMYRVDEETGCWVWLGYTMRSGYGQLKAHGKTAIAHRVSYRENVGEIPAGLDLDHLCRNRSCINPEHLEPVTRLENVRRGAKPVITISTAAEIKRRLLAGATRGRVASELGVPYGVVNGIHQGRSWRDV